MASCAVASPGRRLFLGLCDRKVLFNGAGTDFTAYSVKDFA